VLSGPGRSMGKSIINGVATSYQSYTWLLQPNRTGRLSVGPASIRANNRTYRTNSQSVEVLPVDAELAALAPDNFLRLELDADTAYVGQQVIMNLRLYTTDNVVSRNLVAEPELDAFFSFPRRQFDGRSQNVLENGKEYLARTVASVALYPLKNGELTIEPFRMLLGVIRYRNPQSTFSRRYTERIPLQTDTTKLFVGDLPSPRPANFSGGVGTYRLQVGIDKEELTTDDAITLRMSISGEGDVKRITAPVPVNENDWVIYDPEVLSEEFFDGPTGMYGKKVLEYKIVPRRAGEYDLRPTLNYFDVDSNAFVNLQAIDYQVNVTGGSGQVFVEDEVEVDSTNILTLREDRKIGALKTFGQSGIGKGTFWALAALPILLFGGLFVFDERRRRRDNVDPAELARTQAAKLANRHLKTAREHLRNGAPKAFYDAVEDALLGYLRVIETYPV
ncbi:MAG: BatD family protein, partial [Bacteroidota bacterium]